MDKMINVGWSCVSYEQPGNAGHNLDGATRCIVWEAQAYAGPFKLNEQLLTNVLVVIACHGPQLQQANRKSVPQNTRLFKALLCKEDQQRSCKWH